MKTIETTKEVSSVGIEKFLKGATGDKSPPVPEKNRWQT